MSQYPSVNGRRVQYDEFMLNLDQHKAGDFSYAQTGDGLYLFCLVPGDMNMHGLPLCPKESRPSWTWDGNTDLPTLTPSVLAYDGTGKPVWHGFIRKGVFEGA